LIDTTISEVTDTSRKRDPTKYIALKKIAVLTFKESKTNILTTKFRPKYKKHTMRLSHIPLSNENIREIHANRILAEIAKRMDQNKLTFTVGLLKYFIMCNAYALAFGVIGFVKKTTTDDRELPWVDEIKYLGVSVARFTKSNAPLTTQNVHFSATQMVFLPMLSDWQQTKLFWIYEMQMLARSIRHGLEVCALDKRALQSLDLFLVKLFRTINMEYSLKHVRKCFIVNYLCAVDRKIS